MTSSPKYRQRKKMNDFIFAPFRSGREFFRISSAWGDTLVRIVPKAFSGVFDQGMHFVKGQGFDVSKLGRELSSEGFIHFLSLAGPLYGKSFQILFSRLNPKAREWVRILELDRVYQNWPPLSMKEVEKIMDREWPGWREKFTSPELPALGVASMGQVHLIQERVESRKKWVVKILKPHSKRRLLESLETARSVIAQLEIFAVTKVAKGSLREVGLFMDQLEQETDLRQEKQSMEKIRDLCKKRGLSKVKIPETYKNLNSSNILIMEYLEGISLQSLVDNKRDLSSEQRQRIARDLLSELLVQVFDLGFFHADPHAGNLVLLEDGRIGFMDWGFAGELSPKERIHISKILKALMKKDLKALATTLHEISVDTGQKTPPTVTKIWSKLKLLIEKFSKSEDSNKKFSDLSISALVQLSYSVAAELDIHLPPGLIAMMKTLVTAEGLAKGIDPDISMFKVAAPVLIKAAKPSIRDFWEMFWKFKS